MNKLIASAVLGLLGLTGALAACSSTSDDSASNTEGGKGGKGGSSSAGSAGKGGTSAAGTTSGGTSAGGKGGTSTGGTSTGGTSTGGTSTGGTGGSTGGTSADAGMGGSDTSSAGQAGEDGAAGAPTVTPVPATEFWLNTYCTAISKETVNCEKSGPWNNCFDTYQPYLSTTMGAQCSSDTGATTPKTEALWAAFDNMATVCPSPSPSQVHCNIGGDPEFLTKPCRDADTAVQAALVACFQ